MTMKFIFTSLNKTDVQISNMLTDYQLNVKCVYITL